MRSVALLAGAVLGVLSPSCALRPELLCPHRGGRAFTELTSPHFVLRTDLPPSTARAVVSYLERAIAMMVATAELSFSGQLSLADRQEILLFASEGGFRALTGYQRGAWVSGFFGLEKTPSQILWGDWLAKTKRFLMAGLAARFSRASAPFAPLWVHRGLTKYYETLRLEEGSIIVGEPPEDLRFTAGVRVQARGRRSFDRRRIHVSSLPSLRELLEGGRGFFYGENRRRTAHVGAWIFVHLLQSEHPARFRAYLKRLTDARTAAGAFATAFEGISLETLEQQYRAYVKRPLLRAWKRPAPPPSSHAVLERALDDGEVHLTFGRMRPWRTSALPAVAADLDRALALSPEEPEVLYWKALLHLRTGALAESERHLARALRARPDEPRYWHAMVVVLYRIGRSKSLVIETRSPAQGVHERMAGAVNRLVNLARSYQHLDTLGRYQGAQGNLDHGLTFARQAVKREPSCWWCWDTLALLVFGKGEVESAVRYQQRALDLLPQAGIPARVLAELAERLSRYRKALRSRSSGASSSLQLLGRPRPDG